jgi:hypothetical protein
MSGSIVLPSKRKRGNPNWGQPAKFVRLPTLLTEFERQVEGLGLTKAQYANSAQLRLWCQHNRNRVYVPEWLLEEWGMTVEAIFSGVA